MTFQEFSKNDIEKYLLNHRTPEGKITEILSMWDSAKTLAIENMEKYLRMLEFQEARRSWDVFSGYYWLNQLYIKENFLTLFDDIRMKLHRLFTLYEVSNTAPGSVEKEARELEQIVNSALHGLVKSIRKEIGGEN